MAEPIVQVTSINPAPRINYAGFWIRFLAFLVDDFILIAIFLMMVPFVRSPLTQLMANLDQEYKAMLSGLVDLIVGSIILVYNVLFVGLKGATPGKMVLGLKVVKVDGSPVGITIAVVREMVGKAVSIIVLYFGFIWIAFDAKKQGWHDKIADTVVIKR